MALRHGLTPNQEIQQMIVDTDNTKLSLITKRRVVVMINVAFGFKNSAAFVVVCFWCSGHIQTQGVSGSKSPLVFKRRCLQ